MITVESHKQIKEGRNKTQIRQRIKEIKPPYSKYFSSVSKHLCWSCGITYPHHAEYIRHNLNLIFGRFVVIFFSWNFGEFYICLRRDKIMHHPLFGLLMWGVWGKENYEKLLVFFF